MNIKDVQSQEIELRVQQDISGKTNLYYEAMSECGEDVALEDLLYEMRAGKKDEIFKILKEFDKQRRRYMWQYYTDLLKKSDNS
jgi:hypothetical protein